MMNMMEDSQHGVGLGGVKAEPVEVDHQVEDTVGVSTETIKVQTRTKPNFHDILICVNLL